MSIPLNNINQGGYQPNMPMAAPASNPVPNYGFAPAGYNPVPQMAPPGPQHYAPYGGGGFQPPNYGPTGPVVSQPGAPPGPPVQTAGDWMSIPIGIPNCPPGLEYLTTIDQLLVCQKVEMLEVVTGVETNNKFSIKNALGQKVYLAVEEVDCCTRNACGSFRPFDIKIFDNFRNEVIHLNRPFACSCCPCWLQSLEVTAPPGNPIGSIEQELTLCAPAFRVKNHLGDTVLRIEGPLCTVTCGRDVVFNIVSLTGETIGKISKQWSGFAREMFTDADVFGVHFPMDLDVRMKTVLLGATFLIDAMYFEKSN